MELFERTTLGSLELKNRIFRSATNEHVSNSDGTISEELIGVYEELARGGVGTIITGHYCVMENTRVSINQPYGLPVNTLKMQEAANRVHRADADVKLIMQISHGGEKANEQVNGVRSLMPADHTAEELQEIRRAFVKAALLAKECGFDGVQVHMAHGYFLSGMLDPGINLRTDSYGGYREGADPVLSTADRFRLADEILRDIRKACGEDFTVIVKVNCDRTVIAEDGSRTYPLAPELLHQVLVMCEAAGVDAAEVSGLSFTQQKASRNEPYYLQEVLEASKGVDMPVILVGGLDSRSKMQQVLDTGIPYVSLSRSLICQPDFIHRIQEGAEESPCLRCYSCFRVFRTKYTRCVLHDEIIYRLKECFGD